MKPQPKSVCLSFHFHFAEMVMKVSNVLVLESDHLTNSLHK